MVDTETIGSMADPGGTRIANALAEFMSRPQAALSNRHRCQMATLAGEYDGFLLKKPNTGSDMFRAVIHPSAFILALISCQRKRNIGNDAPRTLGVVAPLVTLVLLL